MLVKSLDDVRTRQQRGCTKTAFVVAAVSLEQKAVLAHLPDQYRVSSGRGGGIIFTCGTFRAPSGDWHVITAVNTAGNIEAGAMVRHAAAEFDKIDLAAFVGIAGSGKDDVAVASVVASQRVYFVHHGKAAKTLLARPRDMVPPRWLTQIAHTIVADEQWQTRVKLNPEQQILLASFGPLEAQVAPIASAEQVVVDKRSETYKTIYGSYNDSCAIEMEGYGTLHAAQEESIPAIVIRGISDKLDNKNGTNDKKNQPLAAATASAFFFELLAAASTFGGATPPVQGDHRHFPDSLAKSPENGGAASTGYTVDIPIETGVYGAPNAPTDRTRLVLILEGDRADFPDGRCHEVVQSLKTLIGCSQLELVKVESGSVVLFLQASTDCEIPSYNKIAFELEKAAEVKVRGFGTQREYVKRQNFDKEFEAASLELVNWPKYLPNGEWIDRAEFVSLTSTIDSTRSSSTILLGGPGTGKTSLLSALAEHYSRETSSPKDHAPIVAVIAIKADSIPTWVKTDEGLRQHLGLSKPLVVAAKAAAQWKSVLLIVDQLDALASNLDLKSERLNLLLNAVRRLSGTDNVHVVASARLFEFEHDARLRATDAESLTLELPAWHQVAEVLNANTISSETLNEKQRTLLRTPQALRIFLETSKHSLARAIPETYSAMLDQFWADMVLSEPNGTSAERFAYTFAQDLANEEALWLPANQYSQDHELISALERSGVLIRAKGSLLIGFSHQTLFEHALSRSFVKSKGELSSYVLQRQTSLFIRPKLVVGLRYLRETNEASYRREFLSLWNNETLRPHLKLLLIDFLGQLPDPTEWEAVLLHPILIGQQTQKAAAWRAVPNSQGWFDFLKKSALPQVMRDEKFSYLTIGALNFAWFFAQADVVKLINENWLPNPAFDDQTFDLLYRCPTWDDSVLSIALEILKRKQVGALWVDQVISNVAVYNPAAAIEILKAALAKRLLTAIEKAEATEEAPVPADASLPERLEALLRHDRTSATNDLFDRDHDWQSVPELAKLNAAEYLKELWPFYISAFHLVARDSYGNAYRRDHMHFEFDFDFEEEANPRQRYRSAPPILDAIAESVSAVALDQPEDFRAWYQNAQNSDLGRVHELIAIGFMSAPQKWASEALGYLLADDRRLMNGTMYDRFGITKQLIGSIAPYLTGDEQQRLEAAILQFQSFADDIDRSVETRLQILRWTRQDRVRLLKAIPEDVASPASKKLILEEERAFGPTPERDINGGGAHFVGSPLSKEQMAKAKDTDLLAFFQKYSDDTEWSDPRAMMRGGSIQLSREFADFAVEYPERALRLIGEFSAGTQERPVAYAIEALAGVSAGRDRKSSAGLPNAEQLEMVILQENAKGFGKDEYREAVARAASRMADRDFQVSEQLLNTLIGWLDRPVKSSDDGGTVSGDKAERDESFLWGYGGLSIVPHGNYPVLQAIETVLAQRDPPEYGRLLSILQDHLKREERPKVWQHLLLHLNRLGNGDRNAAGEFYEKLFEKYPSIVGTPEATRALGHAHWWLSESAVTIWLDLLKAQSTQAYGELLTLVAVTHPDWPNMLAEVHRTLDLANDGNADEGLLRGIAYSAANLWATDRYRRVTTVILTGIIPIATKALAHPILDTFRTMDELPPEPTTTELLFALLQHPQIFEMDQSRSFVTDRLLGLLPYEPELVGELGLAIVDAWGKDLADIRTSMASVAPEAVNLALTLHRMGGNARDLGMRLFERLLELEAYGAREALSEIDERIAPGFPERPRLPRRRRASRRRRPTN